MKLTTRFGLLIMLLGALIAMISCEASDGEDQTDGDSEWEERIWCDPNTKLCWQDPPSPDTLAFADLEAYCNDLVWAGHSAWRAPCILDLRTLLTGCAATVVGGACGVAGSCLNASCINADCAGCGENGCYWNDVLQGDCSALWSVAWVTDDTAKAFMVDFTTAAIGSQAKTESLPVRCIKIAGETDGDWTDGDVMDGDMMDGDEPDGDMTDGDISDGDMLDGDMSDGDMSDGDFSDGDMSDGDMSDGDMSDGDMSDGDSSGMCGCSCTETAPYTWDCTPTPPGTTFTADCEWDDGEACTGWHSIVDANGENPDALFPDGTTFNKSDWGCNSITINCP